MPIFDYHCENCDRLFDIYHRGKEDSSKVKCPACGSAKARKMVSVPASVGAGGGEFSGGSCDSPGGGMGGGFGGGCCGGACRH